MGTVWILLVLLVAILALMVPRMRGRSMDQLFAEREREHHHVHAVLARHPHGGDWRAFSRWMEEEG